MSTSPSIAGTTGGFDHAHRRAQRVTSAGIAVLRYGLVLLLLLWGLAKFTVAEAEGIKPLVANSPLLGWLYPIAGVRGTSALFGVFEVIAAVLIAGRRWFPPASGYASLAAASMFLVTLSFLVTTPDVFSASSPWGGFLMKDIILLGAALLTAGEALERSSSGGRNPVGES